VIYILYHLIQFPHSIHIFSGYATGTVANKDKGGFGYIGLIALMGLAFITVGKQLAIV
jgi:hypothetical protein